MRDRKANCARKAADSCSLDRIPDIPCPFLATPWLHEDGEVTACQNLEVHKAASHPLKIGNLTVEDYRTCAQRVDNDLLIQSLRVFGPRGLANLLDFRPASIPLKRFGDPRICDLCHVICADKQVNKKLSKLDNDTALRPRLQILRSLMFLDGRIN